MIIYSLLNGNVDFSLLEGPLISDNSSLKDNGNNFFIPDTSTTDPPPPPLVTNMLLVFIQTVLFSSCFTVNIQYVRHLASIFKDYLLGHMTCVASRAG